MSIEELKLRGIQFRRLQKLYGTNNTEEDSTKPHSDKLTEVCKKLIGLMSWAFDEIELLEKLLDSKTDEIKRLKGMV